MLDELRGRGDLVTLVDRLAAAWDVSFSYVSSGTPSRVMG